MTSDKLFDLSRNALMWKIEKKKKLLSHTAFVRIKLNYEYMALGLLMLNK